VAAGGLYEQKLLKYRILVAVSAIWAQLPRRQVAYGYMGCSAMCHLGYILFGSVSPIKTDATFFWHKTLKPVLADFHREISHFRLPKKHRRLYGES
jgi:hypothetical protein